MPTVMRQAVRDVAFQKLRDVTIAIAIAAAASVGIIAWVGAATIPGTTATGSTAIPATSGTTTEEIDDDQPSTSGGGITQRPPRSAGSGPGVAVSGGSR